jgi:hypothetical protein
MRQGTTTDLKGASMPRRAWTVPAARRLATSAAEFGGGLGTDTDETPS